MFLLEIANKTLIFIILLKKIWSSWISRFAYIRRSLKTDLVGTSERKMVKIKIGVNGNG